MRKLLIVVAMLATSSAAYADEIYATCVEMQTAIPSFERELEAGNGLATEKWPAAVARMDTKEMVRLLDLENNLFQVEMDLFLAEHHVEICKFFGWL